MFDKTFRCLRFSLFVVALLTLTSVSGAAAPPARTGNWTYDQYYDSGAGVWVARVTSTVNQVMDCTVTWTGLQNGQSVGGHQTMRLPAYPGFGAAIVGHLAFKVGNFRGSATCS